MTNVTMRLALAVVLAGALAAPASAQSMSRGSAAAGEAHREACDAMLTATHDMMQALDADPSADVSAAMKKVDDGAKDCTYPHTVAAAQAFETYAKAVVAHRSGDAGWVPVLDAALTQLAACQSFWGTAKLGAHCATVAATAAKQKAAWSGAPAAAASP
jgi:hypothetical protein